MKTIDLSDSFETALSEALALPDGDHCPISDESMAKALRGLFAVDVASALGHVAERVRPIAP